MLDLRRGFTGLAFGLPGFVYFMVTSMVPVWRSLSVKSSVCDWWLDSFTTSPRIGGRFP